VKIWHVVDALLKNNAREAAEYALMEAGAGGTETIELADARVTVAAYFDRQPQIETIRAEVIEALRIYDWPTTSLIELTTRQIADEDWLAEWKRHWQPVEVGRFIIAPPWSEPPAVAKGPDSEQILIRINPGMAFGTGTHETTRLCLHAIEKYFAGGSFLDVGTGTGILAIAAEKLAPAARIAACDTDAEAIGIAQENARLNQVENEIEFRVGSVDEQTPSADLVCANLTAPVIVELLPSLLGATCGCLVLSGILDSQVEIVQERLSELAATVTEIMQDNEWVALVV
jgi:ribosomal protein L11 methyltransferase